MQSCQKCNISLRGNHIHCPLCKGELRGNGNPADNLFPVIPTIARHRTVLTWITFVSIAAVMICIGINLSLPSGGWWSLFVAAGVGSFLLSFFLAVKKRRNLPKSIAWQVCIVSLLALIWDICTGFYAWSISYAIPILSTCAMAVMPLTAKIQKIKIEEYLIYLILVVIWGILSFVLIVTGLLTVALPSAICFTASIIIFAALALFEGASLKAEIQRRMHL